MTKISTISFSSTHHSFSCRRSSGRWPSRFCLASGRQDCFMRTRAITMSAISTLERSTSRPSPYLLPHPLHSTVSSLTHTAASLSSLSDLLFPLARNRVVRVLRLNAARRSALAPNARYQCFCCRSTWGSDRSGSTCRTYASRSR